MGNAAAGLVAGQEMIRGQVVLRPLGIEGVPIFSIENVCASAASALHLGWQAGEGSARSFFMDLYADMPAVTWATPGRAPRLRRSRRQEPAHGGLNPRAQYGGEMTVEEGWRAAPWSTR